MWVTDAGPTPIGRSGAGCVHSASLISVKLWPRKNEAIALLGVEDARGAATLHFRNDKVATVLGITDTRWKETVSTLAALCDGPQDQLFYRPFRDGLRESYPVAEKLFYALCKSATLPPLFVRWTRVPNERKDQRAAMLRVDRCSPVTVPLLMQFIPDVNET